MWLLCKSATDPVTVSKKIKMEVIILFLSMFRNYTGEAIYIIMSLFLNKDFIYVQKRKTYMHITVARTRH